MNELSATNRWRTLFIMLVSLVFSGMMAAASPLEAAVDTTNNNFTMIAPDGGITGGTNDVHFTWDGTTKTAVAASGQIPNATISSITPFFGVPWTAHDVAVYGPGTYTVNPCCAAGSPGCSDTCVDGSSNPILPITFTVGAGQLGTHMLFDWGPSTDIDVVDVWVPTAAFGPSPLYTGPDGGTNPADKVWDWMSSDWDGNGYNGYGMVDGPFPAFNANFNMMGIICTCPVCDDGNACNGLELCDQINGCVCVAGTPKNCDDADACTTDSCNTSTGNCEHTPVPNCGGPCYGQPNGTVCDDGNLCTTGDACANSACVGTPKNCDDGIYCKEDSCDSATGNCLHRNAPMNGKPCDDGDGTVCTGVCNAGVCMVGAVVNCADSNGCTTDTCDPVTGCTHTPTAVCYTSHANNFTMLASSPSVVGGTNDVVFSWDGTCNTSVATAKGNAAISSNQGFFGVTWNAHDVMVYCPGGPYTVYAGCAPGNPGCGTGASYTFSVGPNQLGAHMLFNYGNNLNIDLVNIWEQGTFPNIVSFQNPGSDPGDNGDECTQGTGTACDGARNTPAKVWDLSSIDWNGDGVPGSGFVDGPFIGFNGNFNFMTSDADRCAGIDCTVYDAAGLSSPCQTGVCDPANGKCIYSNVNEGGACTDYQFNSGPNPCTTNDTCQSGVCVSGTPVANGTPCTLSRNCYANGTCGSGSCNETLITCNDNDICTTDSCDTNTGNCSNSPKCDDGHACTTDSCAPGTGVCTNTAIPSCTEAAQIAVTDSVAPFDDLNIPFVGDVVVRTSSEQKLVTVTNTGNANLTLNNMGFSNPAISVSAPFVVYVPLDYCTNRTLSPGGTCTLAVVFMPQVPGTFNGNLVIKSSAVSSPTVTVTLSGNGVCDPAACDDNNACTADTCNTATGCVHTAICGGAKIGIYENGTWFVDLNGNGAWDSASTDAQYFFGSGLANAIPVTGDWTGTGTTRIGIYENGTWYLDLNGNKTWDGTPTDAQYSFGNGVSNAIPITGDWTGTGTTKIGIYENGTWRLDINGNGVWEGTSPSDGLLSFGGGIAGAVPVTGDWTGTGTTRIGIYENGTWYLDLNGNNLWDGTPTDALYSFGGGIANAVPVTGDWTGTGTTRIGIYENGTWYLDQNGNGVWDGTSIDAQYPFGNGVAGALPVTGKW